MGSGIACVVSVDLDETPIDRRSLSPHELDRARHLVSDIDRHRFIAAHAALRSVIAHATGIAPASLTFNSAAYGKPFVVGLPGDLRFNLSHSDGRALIAVALGREIGIDIERHKDIDVNAIASLTCSRAERQALGICRSDSVISAFYGCWTRKESLIKATGQGLPLELDAINVGLNGARTIRPHTVNKCDARQWAVRSIPTECGYSAALTLERDIDTIVYWTNLRSFLKTGVGAIGRDQGTAPVCHRSCLGVCSQ